MAFEDKQNAFDRVFQEEKEAQEKSASKAEDTPLISENTYSAAYPSHAKPLKRGMARVHRSYTLRPDLVARIEGIAEKQGLSVSAVVERGLMKAYF